MIAPYVVRKIGVDPYLFPARGRKRGLWIYRPGRPREVDPYLFPARGRKHLRRRCSGSVGRLIPTFSPQGDGNPFGVLLFPLPPQR